MLFQKTLQKYLGQPPPARGLSEQATGRGLLLSIFEGSAYMVAVGVIGGQFLAGYAMLMGAGPRGVAVVTALPMLAGVVQVVAAPYLAARWRRVPVIAAGAGLHRIGWALAGFLPMILPRPYWLPAYATMLFLTHAAQFATVPAWWSLMVDLIPEDLRGRYFGVRNAVLAGVGILTLLAAGVTLDRFPGLTGFYLLHGVAGLFGVVNLYLVLAHPEPQQTKEKPAPPFTPLRNRAFRLVAGFLGLWTLAQTLSLPFYSIVMLQEMKLPFAMISWLMVTAALATTASLFAWGPLCDRVGEGRVISWLAPALASVPLGWLFAGQGRLPLLFGLHAVQGATIAGIGLALGNINLAIAGDGADRPAYLALFSGAVGLAAGLGPLIGGLVGSARSVFIASGLLGWLLWAVWWFWYRPRHLVKLARKHDR